MLAKITAETRVKGTAGKTVEYIASVQQDGYMYFNDECFYRCVAPTAINTETEINPDNVQMWYVNRNCWLRGNKFTKLVAIGWDMDEIKQSVDDVQTSADGYFNTLQQMINATDTNIRSIVNTLGHESLTNNGDVLLEVANKLNSVISVVNSQHSTSIGYVNRSIYTTWS